MTSNEELKALAKAYRDAIMVWGGTKKMLISSDIKEKLVQEAHDKLEEARTKLRQAQGFDN